MSDKISRRHFIKAAAVVGGAAAIMSGKLFKPSLLEGAAQAFGKDLFLPFLSGSQRVVDPNTPEPPTSTPETTRTAVPTNQTPAPTSFKNVIFMHHSVGGHLMVQGNVRALFTQKGYDLWDHDYNNIGLTKPNGEGVTYNYNIPNDNTDPSGYDTIFAQPLNTSPLHPQPPQNAFSGLMRHQVIIFKSCYTANEIYNDERLEEYREIYLRIRSRIDQYPDHIFIAFSPPPRNPDMTSSADASRARDFADWLKSSEYLAGHPNLFVFDFFDLLAEADPGNPEYNMLRSSYREGSDSHPTAIAHQTIAPLFVDFVHNAVISYQNTRS